MLSGLHPGLHGFSLIVSEFVQYRKIQQMILEQSPPESLQLFLLKAHRHNFGENRMLLKISRCKLCFVGCVGGGSVVLSSSHCKRIPQSRRLPDVRLTFSILLLCNCEDDSHLEYHASDQHKDSLKFVEKQVMVFLHMLTVYQSPALYAWTMDSMST